MEARPGPYTVIIPHCQMLDKEFLSRVLHTALLLSHAQAWGIGGYVVTARPDLYTATTSTPARASAINFSVSRTFSASSTFSLRGRVAGCFGVKMVQQSS